MPSALSISGFQPVAISFDGSISNAPHTRSQSSSRPPANPNVLKPMDSSATFPVRTIRSAQERLRPYFCLIGQSKRRALSRFALSGQLLSGAKRWLPLPAPPRPSPGSPGARPRADRAALRARHPARGRGPPRHESTACVGRDARAFCPTRARRHPGSTAPLAAVASILRSAGAWAALKSPASSSRSGRTNACGASPPRSFTSREACSSAGAGPRSPARARGRLRARGGRRPRARPARR